MKIIGVFFLVLYWHQKFFWKLWAVVRLRAFGLSDRALKGFKESKHNAFLGLLDKE